MLFKIPAELGMINIMDMSDLVSGLGRYTNFSGRYRCRFFNISNNIYMEVEFQGRNSGEQYEIVESVLGSVFKEINPPKL